MNNSSLLNQSAQDAQDWNDFINSDFASSKAKTGRPKKIKGEEDFEDLNLQVVKQKTSELGKVEKTEKYGVSADPLMKDARNKLNYYLKRIPTYSTLESQIKILNTELNNYKRNNDTVNYNACKEMLATLQSKAGEIKQIFSPIEGEKAKAKRLEKLANIKASEKIKELYAKEKEIKQSINDNSISKICQNITNLRKMLKFIENDDEILDFDEYLNNDQDNLVLKNYEDLLNTVYEKTGIDIDDLKKMPVSHIKDALKENIDESSFNEELKVIRAQIQYEKDLLSGALTLTDIISNLYDIKNNKKDESSVKEILASTHINMVKSAAYGVCSAAGQKSMQYYDDCVSAGLLALTGAINDWVKLQQAYPVSLSFKGWARINITNAIKRELYSQQSGGRLSGSRIADMITRENKKIDSFLENFPQYKEFDKSFIRELVVTMDVNDSNRKVTSTNDIHPIVSESDIMASAQDGDGADLWANVTSSDNVDMVEAKFEYNALIESISALLGTMNKFEKKLFMLYFGFEKKIEVDTNGNKVNDTYTQQEIGEELYNFYVANGTKPKATGNSFSQPAIYDKIKKLQKHISNEINNNPKLKLGFDYLFIYWTQNSHLLEVMSNNRDEIGMKLERNVLRDAYSNSPQALNTVLTDGKRLSDIFDISDTNPLDSDIEEFYKNTDSSLYGAPKEKSK